MTDKTDALVALAESRHVRVLRELRDTGDVSDWRAMETALTAAIEALSAPAEGGKGEALARRFHETYERLAPSFGYETRKETRSFDPESANGKLMIAVCRELIDSAGGAKGACGTCGGRGWIDDGHEQDDGRMVSAPEDCPDCTPQPAEGDGAVYQWHEFAGRWEDFTKEQFDEVQSSGEIVLGETIITPAMTRKLYTHPAATPTEQGGKQEPQS